MVTRFNYGNYYYDWFLCRCCWSATTSLNNTSGGITNTGAISGATTINASGAITGGSFTDGSATLSSGALSGATNIDGSGDLTMGTITMTGFSVDADGDTVTKSLNNTSGGITNTGAIAGATTINASGAITGGSFTDGTAILSSGALSGATNIDGSGDLTMGTNTMTGFSVDADGDTVTKSLNNTNNATIGANLNVLGNLNVTGNINSINADQIHVEDKLIILGSVTTPNNTTATDGGLLLRGEIIMIKNLQLEFNRW